MIGVVATLKVQDGKQAEFEAIFTDLAKQVRANEPGNIVYQLTKSRTDATVYKVLELYKDEDALKAHGGTDYFKYGQIVAGNLKVSELVQKSLVNSGYAAAFD